MAVSLCLGLDLLSVERLYRSDPAAPTARNYTEMCVRSSLCARYFSSRCRRLFGALLGLALALLLAQLRLEVLDIIVLSLEIRLHAGDLVEQLSVLRLERLMLRLCRLQLRVAAGA